MLTRKLFLPLFFVLSTHCAWASSDSSCEPNWTISRGDYNRCAQLPFLAPGNDRRVNLKLLLVDDGFAALQAQPVSEEDGYLGYGKVPFQLETFEEQIFAPKDKVGIPDKETRDAGSVEVTRCISNEKGRDGFAAALSQNKGLSKDERQLLAAVRMKLAPVCVDNVASTSKDTVEELKSIKSETGKQFLAYLIGATAFYEARYGDAVASFKSLSGSNDPWLKETSRYMLGRTELNRSQQNAFDEYGFPYLKKVDQKVLLQAEAEFRKYLKDYPGGRYAPSARGLLRRIYWMSNKPQELADEYEWQLKHPASPQYNMSLNDFAQEADNKLFDMPGFKDTKNPILLATRDLSLMRPDSSSETGGFTLSELQKQQPVFASRTGLYDFLVGSHYFYVQKNPVKALKFLPATIPANMTYLDFSRLILRGIALEASKDLPGARTLWLALLPAAKQPLQAETVQLALALNYQRSNQVGLAFEPGSSISEAAIRKVLIRKNASADLLREIVKSRKNSSSERHLALYTLLYKDLLQGHYQDYLDDYPLLAAVAPSPAPPKVDEVSESNLSLFGWSGQKSNDSYSCPPVLEIAKILAKNAQDPYGLVCLGDFVKANNLVSGSRSSEPSAQESSGATVAVLGATTSNFPGAEFSRGEGYKTIVAIAKADPDVRAYALYRLIKCYAPSGFNDCGGDDVAEPARRSWFKTLKNDYPDSFWTKRLKFYW